MLGLASGDTDPGTLSFLGPGGGPTAFQAENRALYQITQGPGASPPSRPTTGADYLLCTAPEPLIFQGKSTHIETVRAPHQARLPAPPAYRTLVQIASADGWSP